MKEVLNYRKSKSRSGSRQDILSLEGVNKNDYLVNKSDTNEAVMPAKKTPIVGKVFNKMEGKRSLHDMMDDMEHYKYKEDKEGVDISRENNPQIEFSEDDPSVDKEEKLFVEHKDNKQSTYDPFEQVENIADLTLENVKEQIINVNKKVPKLGSNVTRKETKSYFNNCTFIANLSTEDGKEVARKVEVKIEVEEGINIFPCQENENEESHHHTIPVIGMGEHNGRSMAGIDSNNQGIFIMIILIPRSAMVKA